MASWTDILEFSDNDRGGITVRAYKKFTDTGTQQKVSTAHAGRTGADHRDLFAGGDTGEGERVAGFKRQIGNRGFDRADTDGAVAVLEGRITSYNVCYTKLLRLDGGHWEILS